MSSRTLDERHGDPQVEHGDPRSRRIVTAPQTAPVTKPDPFHQRDRKRHERDVLRAEIEALTGEIAD